MDHRTVRRLAALTATLVLVVAACGTAASPSVAPSVAPPASEAPASAAPSVEPLACAKVNVGQVVRCENFYTDYWPLIEAELATLYEEAKATNGGKIVIWDWYELSEDVIGAFTTAFPGLTIETAGYQFELASKIVTAKETGQTNTDYLSGSLTSATALTDGGYFAGVDWAALGVPAEYLTIGPSELLPDSINGWLVNYNKDFVAEVPTSLDDYLAADWAGKLAMASWNGQFFTGYGMANGKDAMQQLIRDLKSSGNLTLTDDPGSLLSTGDKPVIFAGQLYNPNPSLALQGLENQGIWIQFGGVNEYGTNKAGATLYAIWNAYDPDWITARLTEERFSTSAAPFPGLPSDMLGKATGLLATNMAAWDQVLSNGWGWFETKDNRDQWNELIGAADEVMFE